MCRQSCWRVLGLFSWFLGAACSRSSVPPLAPVTQAEQVRVAIEPSQVPQCLLWNPEKELRTSMFVMVDTSKLGRGLYQVPLPEKHVRGAEALMHLRGRPMDGELLGQTGWFVYCPKRLFTQSPERTASAVP